MLIVKVELESESTCGGYSQWKGTVVLPLLLLSHFLGSSTLPEKLLCLHQEQVLFVVVVSVQQQ